MITEYHMRGSGIFLFPLGVKALPKIFDPRCRRLSQADPLPPKIRQDLDYYASGRMINRDGMSFYVLQPVEQIAIRIPTTIQILRGETHPMTGRKVCMLFSERRLYGVHWAFLIHGMLRFG
jgi:hypothetical protein